AVRAARGVVDRTQHVAGPPDVVGGERAGGLLHAHAADLQVLHLLVVGGAAGQRLGEDRRVRGHADYVVVVHERLQVAGTQPVAADVVQPHRYPGLGELSENVN